MAEMMIGWTFAQRNKIFWLKFQLWIPLNWSYVVRS
jgi:hypothetical protein